MKKIAIVSIVMFVVSVLALAAFSMPMPVSADAAGNPGAGCTSETKHYGTINGGVYFQTSALKPGGWMQYPSLSATFDDVPAKEKVKVARLYTGVWGGSPGKGGNYTITVNGNSSQKYQYCDPCPQAIGCEPWQALRCNAINTSEPDCHHYVTGCNVNFISYDVFNDIQTDTNSVTVATERNDSCPRGGWDGRVYLIALLIVYENESMPEMTYWVNEGAPYMEKDSACDGPEDHFNISFYFNGTHISEPDKVKYWTLGFPRVANSPTMEINGNDIGQPDYEESPAGYDVFYRWDNISISYLSDASNFFYYHDPEPFYERVYSAVFVVQGQESVEKPDLIVSEVKTRTVCLTKYVDVTVKNNGTVDADVFNVSLYADDELIGAQRIINLSSGSNETLVFEWNPEDPLGWTDTPEGAILTSTSNPRTYTLRAVADEDDRIAESNESNNNLTASEEVFWDGYMADDPLENYAHGKVRGGMIYTTGDGGYHSGESECPGTKYGTYSEIHYDLEIPGDTKLARLYFYYTWAKPSYKAPKLGITLKTPSNHTYEFDMEKSYNDIKGYGSYNLAWGTYAYDITGYVTESGTYVVNITNLNPPDGPYVGNDTRFAHHYSFAAPAVLVVYENESMPEREYWVNEGADIIYNIFVWEPECCINNATFEGSIDLSKVKNAALGVVAPWSDEPYGTSKKTALYFNGIELGSNVYDNGYYPIGDISLGGIRMYSTCPSNWQPQVGVNLSDVTDYLNASVNIAGQGDIKDGMMPSNAFLMVEYEEVPPAPFLVYGWVNDSDGTPVVNPNVTVTNLNTGEVFTAETNASSNYYQVVTSSENVSASNVLHFYASDNGNSTEFNHTITQEEMDSGGFVQNITIQHVPAGTCGDVTGDKSIDIGDVILLGNHVRYPAKYPVDEWSADVNCDSSIDVGDVILLGNHVRYPAKYSLGCC